MANPGSKQGVACRGGSSYEEALCDDAGGWGEWGECDGDGYQSRYKSCEDKDCYGDHKQTRSCEVSSERQTAGAGSAVLGAFCGFLVGAVVGAVLVYYFLIHRRSGANGSPHYVSAKSQNLYVSLPMLDLKHKHLSNQSDFDTLRSTTTTGTMRSKASASSIYSNNRGGAPMPVSDYETATIKRSRSHSQRNSSLINNGNLSMRADIDSDQLFT